MGTHTGTPAGLHEHTQLAMCLHQTRNHDLFLPASGTLRNILFTSSVLSCTVLQRNSGWQWSGFAGSGMSNSHKWHSHLVTKNLDKSDSGDSEVDRKAREESRMPDSLCPHSNKLAEVNCSMQWLLNTGHFSRECEPGYFTGEGFSFPCFLFRWLLIPETDVAQIADIQLGFTKDKG